MSKYSWALGVVCEVSQSLLFEPVGALKRLAASRWLGFNDLLATTRYQYEWRIEIRTQLSRSTRRWVINMEQCSAKDQLETLGGSCDAFPGLSLSNVASFPRQAFNHFNRLCPGHYHEEMSVPMNAFRVATDAVQATALTSRIICFLAFATGLFHGPRDTYQIGGLVGHKTVGDIIDELSDAHIKLNGLSRSNSDNEDLHRLVREITELSSRLSNIIAEFKEAELNSQEAIWPGFLEARKAIHRDEQVLQFENDLHGYQDRIIAMLTSFVRPKIDRLFNLMSDANVKTGYSDIQNVVKSLNEGLSACARVYGNVRTQQLVRAQQEELSRIRKFRVLNILEYDKMRHRRNEVQEQIARIQEELTPYGGIFPWAFGVDEDEVGEEEQMLKYRTRDAFADWLSSEGGTFYIWGKPGSGKTILMEYLFSHPTTMRELEARSESKKVIRLAHFFSTLVGGDQQTLTGLRRTLLHDLLDQHPEFLSDLGLSEVELDDKSITHWGGANARNALSAALDGIIEKAVKSGTCVCLFIDGLDENQNPNKPGQDDLIIQLKAWQDLGVKLCLASREDPPFEHLPAQKAMTLHQLTYSDMKRSITQWIHQLDSINQETAELLEKEMPVKSGGNFLWLTLAMKDVCRWLSDQTEVELAQLMLGDISPTLDGVLSKALDNIGDGKYGKRKKSSTLLILHFLEKYHLDLDLIGYSFLDAYFRDPHFTDRLYKSRLENFNEAVQSARAASARRRLMSLCGGFVEASRDSRQLKYTHRLTRDFLQRADVHQRLVDFSEGCNIGDMASNLILASKILTLTDGHTIPHTMVQQLLQIRIDKSLDKEPYIFLNIFESLPLPIDLLKPPRSEITEENSDGSHSKDDSKVASLGLKLMEALYCSPSCILTLRGMYEYPSWKLQNDPTCLNTEEEIFYMTDLLIARAFYRKLEEPDLRFIRLFLQSRRQFFEAGIRCCAAHYKQKQSIIQLYLSKVLVRQTLNPRSIPPPLSKANQIANIGLMIELLLRSGLVNKPWFKITTITTQGRKQEMTFRAWIIKLNPPNKDRILQAMPWNPIGMVVGVAMGILVGILIHLIARYTGQNWMNALMMLPGIWRFCRGREMIPKIRWRRSL
ncbi:uncharacterized protein NECHADRAFT_82792 [Fusarium vanettenii 77-13-4]|uniref:Nephrocystin 3-like N-terminal domain-containing protein n=1 Tax=Fusarium vanettenii (strain ATCC MYA-4622 / CBS 123669 / FGSC 9596 / NRRL 45880 / 77-13-4) TaxID=660122 RepID=C7YWV0_FUSV7|nr:uncharacterized protein NECHADRAFT_82792 [Fusarium vanettenii 77-13-4]EEU43721.1 predicted protein [Fusarium vanettenii 77-13-4]